MSKLKNKLINEGKRIIVCSIPFLPYTKLGKRIMNKNNENFCKGPPFSLKNKIYKTMTLLVPLIPIATSSYFLYPLIKQRIIEQKNIKIEKIFKEYDEDKNNALDLKEFYKYYKETGKL